MLLLHKVKLYNAKNKPELFAVLAVASLYSQHSRLVVFWLNNSLFDCYILSTYYEFHNDLAILILIPAFYIGRSCVKFRMFCVRKLYFTFLWIPLRLDLSLDLTYKYSNAKPQASALFVYYSFIILSCRPSIAQENDDIYGTHIFSIIISTPFHIFFRFCFHLYQLVAFSVFLFCSIKIIACICLSRGLSIIFKCFLGE